MLLVEGGDSTGKKDHSRKGSLRIDFRNAGDGHDIAFTAHMFEDKMDRSIEISHGTSSPQDAVAEGGRRAGSGAAGRVRPSVPVGPCEYGAGLEPPGQSQPLASISNFEAEAV